MLPEIRKVKELPVYTPTKWQTVILRNYGMVNSDILALVLNTDKETIEREAKRLNIDKIKFDPEFMVKGYVGIIKNNWFLLPYDQLLVLLQKTEAELEYCLKEDDFLGDKLGGYKPYLEPVKYSPLTELEIKETEDIAKRIGKVFIDDYVKAFRFYSDPVVEGYGNGGDEEKIVYSYSMLYGDTLLDGGDVMPDELLIRLKSVGVNGIWLQGVLSNLSPYPFIKGLDEGYETRRKNLNLLIEKCEKYGIKVYLYINEPRGISEDKINDITRPLLGRYYAPFKEYSLCTERKEVKEYLYSAIYSLAKAVPNLGGIITITMSENLTNCWCRTGNDCPVCGKMEKHQVVPEVNNVICRAVRDAGTKIKVLANLWSWTKEYEWTESDLEKGVKALDEDIAILCVSEMGTVTNKGVDYNIPEYSISKIGPCKQTKYIYSIAKKLGRKFMAKVQINNSWEFSSAPYIPVFDLVMEHVNNLKEEGVKGYMLSWTLGGYPTVALDLVNRLLTDDFCYDEFLKEKFGDLSDVVKSGVSRFSDAFRLYPYSVGTLYSGPQQVGPGNLWYKNSTELWATMVTFPFDDVKAWCGTYSIGDFENALVEMLDGWKQGLDLIEGHCGNVEYQNLVRYANVFYLHFKSVLNQVRFIQKREGGDKDLILKILADEKSVTERLYKIAAVDCKVGYEASNHYYYTQNTFLEKLICLDTLKKEFEN
ncbi:MAG: hypothetical protein E7369_03830 [Clostridiales bacterium]|nr:hypothetical protein [Clostridiales bacterium]